jgi:uncharacterized protein (DUF697 family)
MKKRDILNTAFKTVKKTIMSNQTTDRDKHAETIIRNHVIWSMGAGLIPVLIADIFAVSALQLDMIRQLCRNYEVDFQETQGKAIITSLTSTTLARLTAGSVIKLIPGIGSIIGGVTVSIFAGASTYALGEVFKMHFSKGGTILDFDPDRLRKYYKEKFEKGKKVAKEMKKEQETAEKEEAKNGTQPIAQKDNEEDSNDVLAKLKELAEMKKSGLISKKEFEKLKKKLIDDF